MPAMRNQNAVEMLSMIVENAGGASAQARFP
jgi:hypothetical protein